MTANQEANSAQTAEICGHQHRTFDGAPLICELPKNHRGDIHGQSVRLRDRTEWTHWREAHRTRP